MSNYAGTFLLAIAAAGLLLKNPQPLVMPTRRAELAERYDMNRLLPDPGKKLEREIRKKIRKSRYAKAQAAALGGK